MSKKLTKIIAISLIALIIPVAIVVTAVCLSSAVTYSLIIDTMGYENVGAIKYQVNGKDYEEGMRLKKDSQVTVTVDTTGYNFTGWYTGTAKNSNLSTTTVSSKTSYTFDMTKDIELTARSQIIVYEVKFDNGEAKEIKYGQQINPVDSTSVEAGKYFVGWKIDKDGSRDLSDAEKNSDSVTVADFNATQVSLLSYIDDIYYNISYNGGERVKVLYGNAIADSKDVKAPTGKYCAGWALDGVALTSNEKGEYEAIFAAEYTNSDVDLTPVFDTIKYNVEYDGADAVEVLYGGALKEVDADEGYYHAGWKIAGDETVYTTAEFPAKYKNESTVELTKVQKEINYKVSFNGKDPVEVKWGDPIKVTNENRVTAEVGKYHSGWLLNGTAVKEAKFDKKYASGKEVVALTPEFKDNEYKIKYSGEEEEKTITHGTALETKDPDAGKYFIGWTIAGDETVYTTATFANKNNGDKIELTPKFETIYYMVKYGENAEEVKTLYTDEISDGSNLTVEAGKYFNGWKLDNKAITSISDIEGYNVGSTVVLTPNFETIRYNISFNGTVVKDVAWGAEIKVTNKNRVTAEAGKYHSGWLLNGTAVTEAKFEEKYMNHKEGSETVELIPEFKASVYKVTYADDKSSANITHGDALAIRNPDAGKYFIGWKVAGDETVYTTATFAGKNNDDEVVLTADYGTVKFGVKYEDAEEVEVVYGAELNTANASEGQYFMGWTIAGDDTVYTTATFANKNNGDKVVLTPKYGTNVYSVKYEGSNKTSNVEHGSSLSLGDVNGMYVAGWTITGDDTVYTTATFANKNNNDEVILTAVKTYKKIIINANYSITNDLSSTTIKLSDYKKSVNELDIPRAEYNNGKDLPYGDFSTQKLIDACGYNTEVYECGKETEYVLSGIKVYYNGKSTIYSSKNLTLEDLTIKTVVDKYVGLGGTVSSDEVTVTITLLYEKGAHSQN